MQREGPEGGIRGPPSYTPSKDPYRIDVSIMFAAYGGGGGGAHSRHVIAGYRRSMLASAGYRATWGIATVGHFLGGGGP